MQADGLRVPIPAFPARVFGEWGAEGGADLKELGSLPRRPPALQSGELRLVGARLPLLPLGREEPASLNLPGLPFGDGGITVPGSFCSWTSKFFPKPALPGWLRFAPMWASTDLCSCARNQWMWNCTLNTFPLLWHSQSNGKDTH